MILFLTTVHYCFRYGRCVPYVKSSRENPCDPLFRDGIDHVFVPFRRTSGDVVRLNDFVADTSIAIDLISDACRERARKLLCYFYYPPCGNSTMFEPPNAICSDACTRIRDDHCAAEWDAASAWFNGNTNDITTNGLNFIVCNDPGAFLYPLPHCCSGLREFAIASLKSTTAINYDCHFHFS